MTFLTAELQNHWMTIQPILTIHDESDYERAVMVLNELIDQVGTDEQPPLYDFLDTLGSVIAVYEAEHYVLPVVGSVEILRYLMEEHGLLQADLPEIGSQGVVSEVLAGKRQLNVRQIRSLAERFSVSPAVFF